MEASQHPAVASNAQTAGKLKVLIADDDAPTRILLRAAILQWGYTIVEAKDGEEAWTLMKTENAPQLLILDWLMPKIDGITLCERKKELSYRPYIILLTQVTGTMNVVKGLDAGADEFLSKPFNMAELRSRLFTGARIVQYENQLTTHNKRFNLYYTKLEELITNSLSLTDQLIKEKNMNGNLAAVHENLQNIDKLTQDLKSGK
jgi:DNA-binding response OmpR family regulator